MRCILLVFLFSVGAQAQYEDYKSYQTFSDLDKSQRDYGLLLVPSGFFYSINENNQVEGQTVSHRKREISFYDLKLSYVFRGGFYFGLLYTGETQNINNGGPKTDRRSLGFSLGYMRHGWMALASWLAYSSQQLSGTADVSEYDKGSGFQVDLAYHWRISKFVSVGPQLSYKYISYREAESVGNAQDSSSNSKHSIFTPMLSFIFNLYRG